MTMLLQLPKVSATWSPAVERRKHRRFKLRAPVQFLWKSSGAGRQSAEGNTCDISPHGVFVQTQSCPPLGTNVQIDVFLVNNSGSPIVMRASGNVVRIEKAQESLPGFAVPIKKILRIVRSQDDRSGSERRDAVSAVISIR